MKKIAGFIIGSILIIGCNNQDSRMLDESGNAKYDNKDYNSEQPQ